MKQVVATLVFFVFTHAAIQNSQSSCKDYCSTFCTDSCKSPLATSICMGDTQCKCLCPAEEAECNSTWCNDYCSKKAQTRKFEAHCDKKECKCEFEQRYTPSQVHSKIQSTNITYIGDDSLRKTEFKCTDKFCNTYCTSRGEGRKFKASCDDAQLCHCEYELKPVASSDLLNSTTAEAKCTQDWCSKFCESKTGGGGKFEAVCDETQTCRCQYPKQTFITASGGSSGTSKNESLNSKFHCTLPWCEDYCQKKSDGRKFKAFCTEQEACKCEYAWQPTGKRVVSTGSTST